MTRRKRPLRRCIGCGVSQPKKDLIRIVRSPDGQILSIDTGGKMSGRGAYVCPDGNCLEKAFSGKHLVRALRMSHIDEKVQRDLFTRLQRMTESCKLCGGE